MSKKRKSSQFPKSQPLSVTPPNLPSAAVQTPNSTASIDSVTVKADGQRVQPEQMSLNAHQHIQQYLYKHRQDIKKLTKEDLNAVLRLSQHLRVFGLLSAVGYINQSNAQENNEVRKRTVPVWECLLGRLIHPNNPPDAEALMAEVVKMAEERPSEYMATWRKALILAHHWNFWARAYQQED